MALVKTFLITFLTFSSFLFSQKITLSKSQILKIFKSTIKQNDRNKISVGSNSWFTDNTNNKYFNEKIIEFKNAPSFKRDYCKIIDWTFYKKDSFIVGDADYCNEPPMQKVTKPENYIKLKLEVKNSAIFLCLFNNDKLVDKFLIISLEKVKSQYNKSEFDLIIKLERVN